MQECGPVLTSYESGIALWQACSLRRCCFSGRCRTRCCAASWQRGCRWRRGGRQPNGSAPRVWPGDLHRRH